MRTVKTILIITFAGLFIFSCKPAEQKTMTAEDFIKIENEVFKSDLSQEAEESIAKKYGYTLNEYTDFKERVEKDQELKKKVGEVRLNIHPQDNK